MTDPWISAPRNTQHYVLADVHIPRALSGLKTGADGWCNADVLIKDGRIAAVEQHGDLLATGVPRIEAGRSILMSGLVDCHTHLDKAHVAAFQDFPPCDLAGAIDAMAENKKTWTRETMARRVNFSLSTAYAYGARALRSHVDFSPGAPGFIEDVMQDAQARWKGRIELQLVPLTGVVHLQDPVTRDAIYTAAERQGRIGLFLFDQPDLVERLTPVFEYANARGWDIDLHLDEGLDPRLDGLNAVAGVTLATGFRGTVLCGHNVALNSYDDTRRNLVIRRARAAGLHFVSLPVTNLYLQGRSANDMPQLRGMAPVAALAAAGATVSLGADNVRDGFCAFGDFDPMAVLNLGAQIGHLNEPARDWAALVTRNPAISMGLDWDGVIAAGAPADLVLFAARTSGEMSARTAPQRVVIRDGEWLNADVPDFRALDG